MEKPSKEEKAKSKKRYVQELSEEEKHQEQEQSQKKYVRTARAGENRIEDYLGHQFRRDLKAAEAQWRAFALQLWSALHPDPYARSVRPVADIWRYAHALLARIDAGTFHSPPQIAQARRDAARVRRRKMSAVKRHEAKRMAEITAMLARGEYPGHG